VQERDEEARIFAQAQNRKQCLNRDDDMRVEIRSFGGLERLVIAEEGEHIGRKAAEAKVKVAGFACGILLCKGITEYVDLTTNVR
jgi:hypothetical protein